jgi:thioredoxin 1
VEKHLSALCLPAIEALPLEKVSSSKKLATPAAFTNEKSPIIELRSTNQLAQEIASSTTAVVIDFYSVFCGPCHKVSRLLEDTARKYEGKIKFIKVNVSDFPDLTEKYEVFAVPTVIVLQQKGREVARGTGVDEVQTIFASLDRF